MLPSGSGHSLEPTELHGVPVIRAPGCVLSNVCTHRGAKLLDAPSDARAIRCPYHGRRFSQSGQIEAAPGFSPLPDADLPVVSSEPYGPWTFASVNPRDSFAREILDSRLAVTPLDKLRRDHSGDRRFELAANWKLYVDNYLEGLHIPFVHHGLASAIEQDSYEVIAEGPVVWQLAKAKGGPTLPGGYAAIYAWLFPTTMLNVYPWGVSVNRVLPMGQNSTVIEYERWVLDPELMGQGAGADLDRVEHEDHAVVLRTAEGLRSPLYSGGQYAPGAEDGVRHFHTLVKEALACD